VNPAGETHTIALVIPAYNEATSLRQVAEAALAQHPWVIVVDDGSTDKTAECVADLPLTLLRQTHNQGKAQALWRGMNYALKHGATAVITMDADGQHRAEDIPLMLKAWRTHPGHLVIGSRLHDRSQIPTSRYLANRFANFWVAWAAGYPLSDSQSGFRVYPAALLRAYQETHRTTAGFVFESEIIIEAGRRSFKPLTVPIPAIYIVNARKSHFRPVLDILRITRMVALKLLQRGLCPVCLWRSLRPPQTYRPAIRAENGDQPPFTVKITSSASLDEDLPE
jgi:glycosyltransferase involved in cell wall biosynthesis